MYKNVYNAGYSFYAAKILLFFEIRKKKDIFFLYFISHP